MKYVGEREQNYHFQESMLISKRREHRSVYAVVMNCSVQMTNSIQNWLAKLHSVNQRGKR